MYQKAVGYGHHIVERREQAVGEVDLKMTGIEYQRGMLSQILDGAVVFCDSKQVPPLGPLAIVG